MKIMFRIGMNIKSLIMVILMFISISSRGLSQDKVADSGDWSDPNTWTPNGVPDDDDIIVIPYGSVVTLRSDYTLNNAVMIIEGELIMESVCEGCLVYSNLIFSGSESGIIIHNGGKITDGTILGGDAHYIEVRGVPFWTGNNCLFNCGIYSGSFTFSEITTEPEGLSNPLLVEFLSFTASLREKDVELTWQLTAEQEKIYFSVEQSINNSGFYSIGMVEGKNKPTYPTDYTFIDREIQTLHSGRLFYRIKQINIDGQYKYSKTIVLDFSNALFPRYKVWPNPFKDQLSIFVQSTLSESIKLNIFNSKGQQILSNSRAIYEGNNELNLDKLNDFPPGIYFLYLVGNSIRVKEKIVKTYP